MDSYNGYFSAELILDLTLLVCVWALILDDREQLFDTHACGCFDAFSVLCSCESRMEELF